MTSRPLLGTQVVKAVRPLKTAGGTRNATNVVSRIWASEMVAAFKPWPRDLPDGMCKDVEDPDVFFPFEEDDLEAAQELCSWCPIAARCLSIGKERRDDGVYGGVLLHKGRPDVLQKDRKKKR